MNSTWNHNDVTEFYSLLGLSEAPSKKLPEKPSPSQVNTTHITVFRGVSNSSDPYKRSNLGSASKGGISIRMTNSSDAVNK